MTREETFFYKTIKKHEFIKKVSKVRENYYLYNRINIEFLPPLNHISPHALRLFNIKLSCFKKPAQKDVRSTLANFEVDKKTENKNNRRHQ